jgi:hypothetical protein
MPLYEVISGNIGRVYAGNRLKLAREAYAEYARQSEDGYGRAAGEDVLLLKDGEPLCAYFGALNHPSPPFAPTEHD